MNTGDPVEREAPPTKQQGGVVTLLFTDIVGSTALKQQLGDKAGLQLIHRHHELLPTSHGLCPATTGT